LLPVHFEEGDSAFSQGTKTPEPQSTAINRNRLCCIRSTDVWWLVPFALFTNGARHTSGGRFAPRSHPTTVGGQQWPSLPRPSFSYFGQQWA